MHILSAWSERGTEGVDILELTGGIGVGDSFERIGDDEVEVGAWYDCCQRIFPRQPKDCSEFGCAKWMRSEGVAENTIKYVSLVIK